MPALEVPDAVPNWDPSETFVPPAARPQAEPSQMAGEEPAHEAELIAHILESGQETLAGPDYEDKLTRFLINGALHDVPDLGPVEPSLAEKALTQTAEHSQRAAAQISQDVQQFQQGTLKRLELAEQDALRDFEDAQLSARYNHPAEEVRAMKAAIEAGDRPEASPQERRSAREAAAVLNAAAEEASNPDPRRLWHNADGFSQALFIGLNALSAGAAAAFGQQGPQPMDILMQLMDRDFQAQKDAYEMRGQRAGRAQSAYSLAVQRTDNAVQRELLAKNMMLGSLQVEAEGAGQMAQAQQLGQARQQIAQSLALEKHRSRHADAVAALTLRMRQHALNLRSQTQGAYLPGGVELIDPGMHPPTNVIRDSHRFMETYRAVQAAIQRFAELRSQFQPGTAVSPTFLNTIEEAHGNLRAAMKEFNKTGANLSKNEEQIINSQIGKDPTAVFEFLMPRLEEAMRNIDRQADVKLFSWRMHRVADPQQTAPSPEAAGGLPGELPLE